MHNWRFLLLAFVAVFQPIASYAEGLVDGRQQRCDLRTASLRRDPGLPFHGTHRFTKPLDARCLNERDVRAVRRNELREDLRSIKTPERRLVDTLESRGKTTRPHTQAENRLAIDNTILRRETRWGQFRSEDRNQRNREIDRLSIASDNRRNNIEKSRHSNKLEDEIRINNRRSVASGTSMESRRETERYRDSANLQRAQEIRVTRAVSERARDDLAVSSRLGRERAQEMRRAEVRIQQRNSERQILNRRSSNTEPRSWSFSSVRVYRAYNNEDSRRDTQSLDRDERLNTRSRRSIDGKPQLASRITSRVRVSAEQKIIRDSPERSDHRRLLGERDARQLGRRFVEERSAERDRDTRLTRATRFEANRVSQNLRTDALLEQRARSAENRRNARDIRNMEMNFRSGERSIENQRAYRLDDRETVTEKRREVRNINRESRVVTQNRAADNNRKVHNIVRKSREIRDEADIKDNESCSLNRARSTERRMTGQDSERVSRILTTRRDAENQKGIRNKERDARVLWRERAEINRDVDRDSRIFGRERTTERNIRMNPINVRSAHKERSLENQRDTRNAEFQRVRVERSSRRDIRNIVRGSSSLGRVINHLDNRDNARESRSIEKRASSGTRANRDSQWDFRTATLGLRDSRNVERQSRQIGDKLIIDNLRAIRIVDRDSAIRERSAESRRDIRQVQLPQVTVNRRERAAESRVTRNIDRDTRAFRTVKARTEARVDRDNIRDYQLKEHENSRVAERLNVRDARRSRSVRESNFQARRNSERNNFEMERREAESRYRFNTELARKRDVLNTQAENETSSMNWQYLLYTLQGLYICGILSQLMNERTTGKKPRALSWYSTPQHLIKAD